jgi:adenylate cyclase
VAYGNVGSAKRLDFTVIGRAVNRAARFQEIAKQLGQRVVTSEAFAQMMSQPLTELGHFRLRGIERLERIFGTAAELRDPR